MASFIKIRKEKLPLKEYEMIVGGGLSSSKTYVGDGLYYRGNNLYHDNCTPPKGSLYEFKPGDSQEMQTVKSEMLQDALETDPCQKKGIQFHPEVFRQRSK